VFGVVVPHVKSREEARKIVAACRYPPKKNDPQPYPRGTRGASPWIAAHIWGLTMEEYVERADVWPLDPRGELLCIIMIEDPEAVENIDEILSVPGISAVIFGPYDYSFGSGNYGNSRAEEVLAAEKKVKAACDRHGVPLIGFANPENFREKVKAGYPMLLLGSDLELPLGPGKILEVLRGKGK